MGQRANYIVKDQDQLAIHYNHWRANCIASDLYLGEKRFLQFVEECLLTDEILDEPWIEGCVVIDKAARQLYFWSIEFSGETSVIEYYLSEVSKKWRGWTVRFLAQKMYDVEPILGIDYIQKQELPKLDTRSKEDILNDKPGEWVSTLVIIKDQDGLFVTKTGNLYPGNIIAYGPEIVRLIRSKEPSTLPAEDEAATYTCLVIDATANKIFLNQSEFGLRERAAVIWKDYAIMMGDYGYIGVLRFAGIDTTGLEMPADKVREAFEVLVRQDIGIDPYEMADRLASEHPGIQFNHDFFDTVRPKKTLWERLRTGMKRLLSARTSR